MPPASSGVINGKTALLLWPVNASNELLEPSHCAAHMIPYDHPDDELTFDCGVWFQPPVGKYRYWLEKDERLISRYPTIVYYAGAPFEGSSLRVLLPLGAAGQVALRTPRPSDQSLRFLHIPASSDRPAAHRSMDRRVRADAVIPVLMPEGEVIGGTFDRHSGDAIAITRPVHVTAGHLTYFDPKPPAAGSDILAILERPAIRSPDPAANARVVMRVDDVERSPDVLSDTANRVVAVWYGVTGRNAEVVAQTNKEFLSPESFRLVPGRVTTIRHKLSPLPSADIQIHAPRDLSRLTLEITSESRRTAPMVREVEAVAGMNHVANLPAEQLAITLTADNWKFVRKVDLRSGIDAHIDFDIEPFIVEGNVFGGDRGTPASLTFGFGKHDLTTVTAASDGHYRVILWSTGSYVVSVATAGAEPYVEPFVEVESDVHDLDFHIPSNQIVVRVADTTTGAPIKDALVMVKNVSGTEGENSQVESRHTGDDGSATLPPLKPGHASIRASAEKYRTSAPIELDVDNTLRNENLDIALSRFDRVRRLQIVDAAGAPAIDAELLLIASETDERPLWQGVYGDPAGIDVPALASRGLLLVRHRGSASAVVTLTPDLDLPALHLENEAPPLVVRARTNSGDTAPSARLGVWFGSHRMTTLALGFLTWSQPAIASKEGIWIGRGLPPAQTRVVAWRRALMAAISGAFDGMATDVRYPWPAVVDVISAD